LLSRSSGIGAVTQECRSAVYRSAIAASALTVIALGGSIASARTASPPAIQLREARLTAPTMTLPISMVREFPFVEGEVAGVKGRFMLDTGMEDALVINDHRVPLQGGEAVGHGFFESGQRFAIREHADIEGVRIAGLSFDHLAKVRSQDARQLERITRDFLGWIGYGFFKDHALKIDYRRKSVTFYRGGPAEFLGGEKVVAVLPFETRRLPNHPLLAARIGDLRAIISLDTGMNGALVISDAKKAQLFASGHLKRGGEEGTYDITGVRIANRVNVAFPSMEVERGPSPSAKPIGITEDVELQLGYALLKQYKAVWDFRGKRLYLLAR
jgi:hypothetical protein